MAAVSTADMNGLHAPPGAPHPEAVFEEPWKANPRSKPSFRLPQNFIFGIGLAVLAIISAASIAFDVKSRSDAAWVNHSLEVSNKLTDTRLELRRAESAARGYVLTKDQYLVEEYRQSLVRITSIFVELKDAIKDNPGQSELLATSGPLVIRRFAITSEMISLYEAGDVPTIVALTNKAEGRALMQSIVAIFDRLVAEEQRLLVIRSAKSERTGSLLLTINLVGAALILVFAAILITKGRLSRRKLEHALDATKAENRSLEVTAAERAEHLLAAHEKLRTSASIFNSTFSGMAEAVLVLDNEEKIILSNAAAERLLQYCLGMTTGQLRLINVAYHTDGSTQLAPSEMPITRALHGEQFDEQEIIIRRSGNRDPIYLLVSGRPLHDTSGAISGASLIYRDITEVRETERKLHQSQKLDAIGKLTGGVAHDFNNMLTVITGITEILVADLHDRPDLLEVASLIDRAAARCAELIHQLLAFASKQPLQPRNVDINGTVLDIAKLLRPTLGEQIEIETILEQKTSTALVDPSQLANALINLAINARHAMPNGGTLRLETASVGFDDAHAQGSADICPGAYLMIAVSDTGTGMSAEVCEKMFEPFFTTKEMGKGTGLGLSMVYGFVKQSGGHIKVYSEQGHGTTIKLYLPAVSRCAGVPVPAGLPTRGAGEAILVVEDDGLVRGFVIAQLHSLGYTTVAVADGRAALACLDSGQPFDLLFTDVVMPGGMTGRELADEVTMRRPGMKILFTSGYAENAIVHEGRSDQAVMLLSKPYRKTALASMIRLALGDAAAKRPESRANPRADTSFVVPMRRQPAGVQELSSG
jgi:PAS domain S-box-containing protein